jgi:hypothetical protein
LLQDMVILIRYISFWQALYTPIDRFQAPMIRTDVY